MFRGKTKNLLNLGALSRREITFSELLKIPETNLFPQQIRNTHILKRRHPVPLIKQHYDLRRTKLRDDHFVYDLVEETDWRKKEPIKVLLIKPVEALGLAGDVIYVKPNVARNKLLLPGLAVYASPENLEKYAHIRTIGDGPSSPYALKSVMMLEKTVFSVTMNMEIPWEIEPWHVRVGFRKGGFIVPESALALPSQPIIGPDLSLENKEFLVKVKINNKEAARVRFRVHHVPTDPRNSIRGKEKFWMIIAQPVFEEEAEILAELNRNDPKMKEDEEEA